MHKKYWTILAAAAVLPLGWWAHRRLCGRRYLVITAHGAHAKAQILCTATADQLETGVVVPVQPGKRVPPQAQVNAQLDDATDDLSFQNP